MKFKYLLAVLFLLATVSAFTQSKLPGFNYQAVARDERGQIMANKVISLRINLLTGESGSKPNYTETHVIRTNELGLFNLVIGEGEVVTGEFSQVPWSSRNIWMELAIDENGGINFTTISSSQLMAVPYALHAGTADQVIDVSGTEKSSGPYWKTNGNSLPFPGFFIGTTNCSDLVFKTNNIERMRITCAGVVTIPGAPAGLTKFSSPWINTFDAPSRDTIIDGTQTKVYFIDAPELTPAVINSAQISVYFRVGGVGPYELPYISNAGGRANAIMASFYPGRIGITRPTFNETIPNNINLPLTLEFRYTIIQ